MARPKVALISRRKALEAALEIVDAEGLGALSIRRLGEALNVNGASLYHHFKNKDEILVGVTQLALADVATPRTDDESWRTWLPRNMARTREALVRHPDLIPVMLRRASLGIGLSEVEASVERLCAEGVPLAMIVPLMESGELLAISSALQEVGLPGPEEPDAATASTPMLRQALDERSMSSLELFEIMATAMISLIESSTQIEAARQAVLSSKP